MPGQIEHSGARFIQETMRRIGIVLLLLLPVFGLALAGSVSADASDGGAGCGSRRSLSAAAGQAEHSARDLCVCHQAARSPGRRTGVPTSPPGKPGLSADGAAVCATPEAGPASFRAVTTPAELVRGWQFRYHAAAEPRAPPSVSSFE